MTYILDSNTSMIIFIFYNKPLNSMDFKLKTYDYYHLIELLSSNFKLDN